LSWIWLGKGWRRSGGLNRLSLWCLGADRGSQNKRQNEQRCSGKWKPSGQDTEFCFHHYEGSKPLALTTRELARA
jgi:hypothetical protein